MALRRVTARLIDAVPSRADGGVGVRLCFRVEGSRLGIDRVEDYADLGPALTIPAVNGLGKVLRILRAARIAPPQEPLELVGREERAAKLLARAVGTAFRLELRPRVRLRFIAWTERGVETVDDVSEVHEEADAYFVRRRDGRLPVRFDRAAVTRQCTESERWHEIVDIERV